MTAQARDALEALHALLESRDRTPARSAFAEVTSCSRRRVLPAAAPAAEGEAGMSGLFSGKRALVVGVANDQSIAWGVAEAMRQAGASSPSPISTTRRSASCGRSPSGSGPR